MKVIEDGLIVAFDVDGTLVSENIYNYNGFQQKDKVLTIECEGKISYATVIKENVDKLIMHSCRGQHIWVWSNSGAKWAEAVIKALGLEKYVHQVSAKPRWLYDDKTPDETFGEPRWGYDAR